MMEIRGIGSVRIFRGFLFENFVDQDFEKIYETENLRTCRYIQVVYWVDSGDWKVGWEIFKLLGIYETEKFQAFENL